MRSKPCSRGVAITLSTWQASPDGTQVGVAFRDTGRGIPPGDIEKLFDPYFTTKETGIGLGLTTCEEIITQHEGEIEVESLPGVGTSVTIWLPQPGVV